MAKIEFETGSNARIKGTFRTPPDATPPSVLTDPAIVTLTIRHPDKTTSVYQFGVDPDLENPSTGQYELLLPLTEQGTYHWRWRGANGGDAGVITGALDSVLEPNF